VQKKEATGKNVVEKEARQKKEPMGKKIIKKVKAVFSSLSSHKEEPATSQKPNEQIGGSQMPGKQNQSPAKTQSKSGGKRKGKARSSTKKSRSNSRP
jgi:hypothetical protein